MLGNCSVYLFLMFIMVIFSWCGGVAKKYKLIWAVLASISFGVTFGIRYGVGVDFFTYLNTYDQVLHGNINSNLVEWEWLFKNIYIIFAHGGFHYSFPFGLIAFLQCFLIYFGLRKQYRIWWLVPITLILSSIWLSYSNIMRHMLAFSFFVTSIQYLANRNYLKYYLIICLAILCHKSAFLLTIIPIYYIFKPYCFSKIFIQLILFGLAFILINLDYAQEILESLSTAIAMFGYDDYLTSSYAKFNEETTLGLGVLTIALLSSVVIIHSNKLKNYYHSRTIEIMYDLYFIGLIIRFAFARMFLLQRINYYFYSFEFIVGALLLGYFYYNKKYLWFSTVLSLYVILFLGRMVQAEELTAAYHTFFEK